VNVQAFPQNMLALEHGAIETTQIAERIHRLAKVIDGRVSW
jgi:hypothetical protein